MLSWVWGNKTATNKYWELIVVEAEVGKWLFNNDSGNLKTNEKDKKNCSKEFEVQNCNHISQKSFQTLIKQSFL